MGMDSKEFLEQLMKEQKERDLGRIIEVQIRNLEIIAKGTKEALENLGKVHDDIKTKEVREKLEDEMKRLAKIAMDNEEELEELRRVIK